VVFALLDHTSTRSLSKQVAPLFRPDEQIVMIDEYDLPFYLRAVNNSWVVSDWQDPEFSTKDNWRKELYDAARFDPLKQQEVLLLPGDLASRLCSWTGSGVLWIWGKTAQADPYPFLPDGAIAFSERKKVVWRLDAEQRQQLDVCRGTPGCG
jgi:hypothetical protein